MNTTQEQDEDTRRIGDTMTRVRLMMGRRVISRIAIARVNPELELSQLDTLDVVRRIRCEAGEVTVGAIADAMHLDASRGSRLVADLVSRGILRRVACQEDGRRSLIEITETGEAVLAEIRAVKQRMIEDAIQDWPAEDRTRFSHMFERFIEQFYAAAQIPDKE